MAGINTIILAAGRGTRMKSDSPKVLHKVNGRTILEYVVDLAHQIGSLKIYTVLGYKSEEVKKILPEGVHSVIQKKLLGTADALRSAAGVLKNFSGDVLVMCGDTPLLTKETVKRLVREHKQKKSTCTVLTCIVENPDGYGRIIRSQGRFVAIREDKDATDLEKNIAEINVGVYCFKAPDLLKFLKYIALNKKKKEFYLTDIIELLAKEGKTVESVETSDPNEGLGINTREDLAYADKILRQRTLKKMMAEGITIVDPDTTFIQDGAKIGRDTIIYPFTFIEQNVRIGHHCKIGPFARLRMGTVIGHYVEVGNFAEVSRTTIGDFSFMKHFSFLGDAHLGAHVNIGAGTVTANFDGVNKNKTVIADKAFIGSDSVLIAPIRIGRQAVVGAGSVVTKNNNVPNYSMALGVPAVIKRNKK